MSEPESNFFAKILLTGTKPRPSLDQLDFINYKGSRVCVGFEPHRRHCVVSLIKNINPSLVHVQPWKIRPFLTEILLLGRNETNQANKTSSRVYLIVTLCIRENPKHDFYKQ